MFSSMIWLCSNQHDLNQQNIKCFRKLCLCLGYPCDCFCMFITMPVRCKEPKLAFVKSHAASNLYIRSGLDNATRELLVDAEEEYVKKLEEEALPLCEEWWSHFSLRDTMQDGLAKDMAYPPQKKTQYVLCCRLSGLPNLHKIIKVIHFFFKIYNEYSIWIYNEYIKYNINRKKSKREHIIICM